jgi:hypothetical protein
MLLTGLAKMHVHVDESRCDEQSGCVECLASLRRFFVRPEPSGDASVFDQKRHTCVLGSCGIDEVTVGDKKFHLVFELRCFVMPVVVLSQIFPPAATKTYKRVIKQIKRVSRKARYCKFCLENWSRQPFIQISEYGIGDKSRCFFPFRNRSDNSTSNSSKFLLAFGLPIRIARS